MNKNKDEYIKAFEEVYLKKTNINYNKVIRGYKILYMFAELNKKLPLEEQKKNLDILVGYQLWRRLDTNQILKSFLNLYKQKYRIEDPNKYMEKLSDDRIEYKEGNVYTFKYKDEEFYRFFVIIKEMIDTYPKGSYCSGYMHVLKYTSDVPQIKIDKVGWDDILTKLPIKISELEFEREYKSDKEEKYYKLVATDVKIDKEELNFLEYKETNEETNIDRCLDIYNNKIEGEHILTAQESYFYSPRIKDIIDEYEQYSKYLGEEILDLFKYDNNWEDYIERNPQEIKEVPKDMMQLVNETDIPKPEIKYKSVRVKKMGEEYSYFKTYDEYLTELSGQIEKINPDIIDEEDMTGENFEILIRYYLEEKGCDLIGINSDSDVEIISFISKDEKKLKEIVKEINKFLKNQDEVLKYIKENIGKIEWI